MCRLKTNYLHMKIEQIYTGCLAQGAYYIQSENEAAIIDPLREVNHYIQKAEKDNSSIKYIFETHFHADFVSGHIDLSKKTGAPIIFGPTAKPAFNAIIATDGQEFKIGKVILKVLHTPGHTLESSIYLLKDEKGKDHAIFTGDTLFLGDVGRPDLAQKATDLNQYELAAILYDSIMTKIMPLADDVIVYPAHGAGSACGKNMMKETVDTLGHQKQFNYALLQPGKIEFVKAVTEGLLPPPAYFPMNVSMNKEGYKDFDQLIQCGMKALNVKEFEDVLNFTHSVILDTRPASLFCKAFIPNSINIGLDGQFAPWAGTLIRDVKQSLVLVTENGKEEESITRLARVGFDHIHGYLKGGFESWQKAGKETDAVQRISAIEFAGEWENEKSMVIDVRRENEFNNSHLEKAINKPLDFINDWTNSIDPSKPFYLHCAGGYRSMMAASILKSRGIHHFKEVDGGYNAISKTDILKKLD
jgi:glyoxylase-like metal-dependent hydrolase (beta-lactamase superfamily II)/rhodanese-related sulfurtransferase